MQMKPFDLHAAISGKKVILRNGEIVTIAAYNPNAAPHCRLIAWMGSECELESWSEQGKFNTDGSNGILDVVGMAPTVEVRTRYINTFPNGRDTWYDSKEEADIRASSNRISCIKFEYEVEID